MPESELAKEVTRVIKKADKLVKNIKKDTCELLEALRELKKDAGEEESGNDEK